MADDGRQLVKVATLYYKDGLTQSQVAERLGISRQMTARLLEQARKQDIVHIEIRSPLSFATELESKLERAFFLKEAVVVHSVDETDDSIKTAIGQAAAQFAARAVQDNDILGVSWSSTIYQFVLHMEPVDVRNVTVVGLNGSLNITAYPTHAEFVIHKMAEALRATPMVLSAPMFVDREDIKNSLLADSNIRKVLDLARRSTFAMFGIGDLSENSSPYKAGYVSQEMLRKLTALGIVGDICGRFYDVNGTPCLAELGNRTIAVDLRDFVSKRYSVGVAGGMRKVDAILGALRGRFCNVLITDERTAQALLDRNGISMPPGR